MMIDSFGSSAPADYRAAYEDVVLYNGDSAGRLWLRGRDRAALPNRLSTNQIEGLAPGQGCETVFTTPIGRIIDLAVVHVLADELLLVSSPGRGAALLKHLRKNIFFNDALTLEDASTTLAQLTLYGPQSAGLLRALGVETEALAPFAIAPATLADTALWIARVRPLGGAGFALYLPAEAVSAVQAAIAAAGATPLGAESFELLRVEAGYGASGHELTDAYIPLETGLISAISFNKGCYVGQEIIARMESRGRLAKQLRGLRLSAPIDVAAGAARKLSAGGNEAGDLTSTVVSPRYGPIGLAYVRTGHATPGTIVALAASDLCGEVVALPFV